MKKFFLVLMLCSFCSGKVWADDEKVVCKTENNIQFCVDENGEPITGKVALKYENGNTKSLENLKNGYRNGLVTEFGKDGSLVSRSYYKMGVENGEYKLYHKNRQLKLTASKKEGILHGVSEIYDDEGNLVGKITYNKGRVKNGFCRQSAKSKRVRLTFFEIQNLPDNFLVLCGQ